MKFPNLLEHRSRKVAVAIFMVALISLGALSATITPKTYSSEAIVYLRLNSKAILDSQQKDPNMKFTGSALARINGYTRVKSITYLHLMFYGDTVIGELSKEMGRKLIPGTTYYLTIPAMNLWKFKAFGPTPEDSAKLANLLVNKLIALIDELEKLNYGKDYQATIGSVKIQDAVPVSKPITPVPLRNFFLSIILGILLILLFNKLRSNSSRYLKSIADVTKATGLKSVGIVPEKFSDNRITDSDIAGAELFSNFINQIRTALLAQNRDQSSQIILFTAALPDQGTSFITEQVANSFAQVGKTVCYVHANLHTQGSSQSIGENQGIDLSSLVLDYDPVTPHVFSAQKSSVTHASVNTPGSAPSELFLKPEFSLLVTKLRNSFDYVLIDGPPLLTVSDSAVLAKFSDTTVFVVRASEITRAQARNAVQGLTGIGITPIGFILNSVPEHELKIDGKFRTNAEHQIMRIPG